MQEIAKPVFVEQDADLKRLLTALRLELNLLNTLNCNVHKYQGDFSIEKTVANLQIEAMLALYEAHLQTKVAPLFAELGRMLVSKRLVEWGNFPEKLVEDAEFASVARRWYQGRFSTGVLW